MGALTLHVEGPLGVADIHLYPAARGRYSYSILYQSNIAGPGRLQGSAKNEEAAKQASLSRAHRRVGLAPPEMPIIRDTRSNARDNFRDTVLRGLINPSGKFRSNQIPIHAKLETNPASEAATRRFVIFHSTPVTDVIDLKNLEIGKLLPPVLPTIGEGISVQYRCRKDDPLTRSKREYDARHDPDGVIGIPKNFIHKHDHSHGGLYGVQRGPAVLGIGKLAKGQQSQPVQIMWPDTVYWLGNFNGVNYYNSKGKEVKVGPQAGWEVWGFPVSDTIRAGQTFQKWLQGSNDPDAHVLFAVPSAQLVAAHFDSQPISDMFVWCGGTLNVTYHGIGG